jgi:hypothetical protein
MSLAPLQHTMWQALTGDADLSQMDGLVRGGALSAHERISVYAEMYWLRLRDVLREEFRLLRAVLGDEDFDILAAKYVRAFPSSHPSLNWLGQHLEQFLRSTPIEGAPFLSDLAALEFARSQAFIAADSTVVGLDALQRLTPESSATARFTLTPSVRVLRQRFDLRELFRALADGSTCHGVDVPEESTSLVVFRQGFSVFHARVDDEEAFALERAMAGATLPELCSPYADHEDGAARAFKAIGSWVAESMVARIDMGE